jgi:Tol biopolymer transport system component
MYMSWQNRFTIMKAFLPTQTPLFALVMLGLSWAGAARLDAGQLLSVREGALPFPVSANGDSILPQITPAGRHVLFTSGANDLVGNDNSDFGLDVFVHDRVLQRTILASANWTGSAGGNGDSIGLGISANGRYVLFQSDATNLRADDTNQVADIFVRDVEAETTALVSGAANGEGANGASTEAVMTPDGRWVAFVSAASNLVSGDTNGIPDLFLRDVTAGTTKWITAGATGANATVTTPVITPDGRYVAFASSAKNLVPDVPVASRGEIYLYDALTETLTWVSTNASEVTSTVLELDHPPSYHPALSADGRLVTFKCGWTNGTVTPPGSGVAAALVFVYDAMTGATSVLTTNASAPWPYQADGFGPEITPDGRFVVAVEREGGDFSNLGVWDLVAGTNSIVSVDQNGFAPTNALASAPVLSPDGRFLTFISDATNLVSNVVSNGLHIYWRDLQTGVTVLVDADLAGVGSGEASQVIPYQSADGRWVVFAMLDATWIPGDNNKSEDVFLWDSATSETHLISHRNPAVVVSSGNAGSALGKIAVSADGRVVAFASFASDLVSNDDNAAGDVYVRQLNSGSNMLASVGLDGNAGKGGNSWHPRLNADGRQVIFLSSATNLVANDTNQAVDLFRRDLDLGVTTLESVNAMGGNLGTGDVAWPTLSQDGRYVVFQCRTNLSFSPGLFWRDLESGVTVLVRAGVDVQRPPSLSADGKRVAYFNSSGHLLVWDANIFTHIYTNTSVLLRSVAMAPAGDKWLYQADTQLWLRDQPGLFDGVLYPNTAPLHDGPHWSADGRYIVFVTAAALVPQDVNGVNDVYLRDLQTGALTLVSTDASGLQSADGASDAPVISTDGRVVIFRSFATNALPGIYRSPALLSYNRITGERKFVAAGSPGAGWSAWVSRPNLNTNAATIVFSSTDEGWVHDRNRAGDVFVAGWLDTDEDGIPDWWLEQYFQHPTGEAGDWSRADDDADGDGMTNLEEYYAGTDPTRADSVLRTTVARVGEVAQLSWIAMPGRNYLVQSTTNLSSPVWQVYPGPVSMVGGQGYLQVTFTGGPRYFRVRCEY